MLPSQQMRPRRPAQQQLQIFVYHHTHWDREWWATMQDFRVRLVELIDELLDTLDRDQAFRCFALDGQTIVLKDYLEVRPENRDRLAAYINADRIQCGPWHVLPDEFLVSGEAHIRNLWLGRRTATQLGVRNQDVGYIPDTFGHIAQMPQILRGFGIDSAMIWRGLGGAPADFKHEFLWEAADDSRVLAHWFPDGYYQMPFLHLENEARPYEDKVGRVRRLISAFAAGATTDCVLLPYGGDHRPIDRRLPRLIREVQEQVDDLGELVWATAGEYIAAVRARNPQLDIRKGEFRLFGADLPHVLPGVLSARMYLKQLNFHGQTWLERYAEPLSALAWLHGGRYDAGLLWTAWELLVQNHPHDSICGCSIDQVHREMIPRFDQSRQIAQILAEKSARQINEQIDTSNLGDDDDALVVYNSLAWPRTGPANVLLARDKAISPHTHELLDQHGDELPFQVRHVDEQRPMTDQWRFSEIRFVARDVPALGYRAYRLRRRAVPLTQRQMLFGAARPTARLKGSHRASDLLIGDGTLENAYLKVIASQRDGTLTVVDKVSGQSYAGLNAFEDGGDAGDTYAYAAPLSDTVLYSREQARVHVAVAEAGFAAATLRIDLEWRLPQALADDRLSRSASYVTTTISTFVSLSAEASRVEIRTEWDNRASDHRLRVLFPFGADVQVVHAEGHFDVAERPVALPTDGRGWDEPPVATRPQQGFVSVDDGTRGLTIANKGLPEYEVLQDGQGSLALTLLRAVGWLSREDTLVRSGGAGPETPTPEAQCHGRGVAEYAIIPHLGGWLRAHAYRRAHGYLAPLYGSATGRHRGELPQQFGLLQLDGDHDLLLSACKKAERSDALILRFWNVGKVATEARLRLGRRPVSAWLVDLREQPTADAPLPIDDDGSLLLRAGPAKIVTLALQF